MSVQSSSRHGGLRGSAPLSVFRAHRSQHGNAARARAPRLRRSLGTLAEPSLSGRPHSPGRQLAVRSRRGYRVTGRARDLAVPGPRRCWQSADPDEVLWDSSSLQRPRHTIANSSAGLDDSKFRYSAQICGGMLAIVNTEKKTSRLESTKTAFLPDSSSPFSSCPDYRIVRQIQSHLRQKDKDCVFLRFVLYKSIVMIAISFPWI